MAAINRLAQISLVNPRRSQREVQETLQELRRMLHEGVTTEEVCRRFGVKDSRAYELMNQVESSSGEVIVRTGSGRSRIHTLPGPALFNLSLQENEVVPALLLLRDAPVSLLGVHLGKAKAAGKKVQGVLDRDLAARYARIAARVSLQFRQTEGAGPPWFWDIVNAMVSGKTIRFRYADGKATPSLVSREARAAAQKDWHAEPWAIFYERRHLYAVVRRLEPLPATAPRVIDEYSSLRTVKLKRMEEVRITNEDFTLPEEFSVSGYLKHAWAMVREPAAPVSNVVIEVHPSAAENIVDTVWHQSQRLERNADGSAVRTADGWVRLSFRIQGVNEILYWILGLGRFVRVVKPESLRRAVQAEVRLMQENMCREGTALAPATEARRAPATEPPTAPARRKGAKGGSGKPGKGKGGSVKAGLSVRPGKARKLGKTGKPPRG